MSWPFDPTVYLGLAALLAGYLVLGRRTADSDGRSRRRSLFFVGGTLIVWLALETPIDRVSDQYLQSVHMTQHVLIGFIAPPLFLLGLSSKMAQEMAQEMAQVLRRVPGVRQLTEPIPAQLIFGVVMLVWHVPALYDLTLRSEAIHVVEHLSFIVAGTLFWWPVITVTSQGARHRLG
ncbi:MAG: cytochrome c oxidase assembly protein, partial [Candidatus Dormibacteraeota bacterium]|nr:cytochrome c oxidase assembly protein [Candidatus Dormibacteraeota bacterium]